MNPRFERRREHLLKDAEVKPQVYREALKRLPEFIEPYFKSLGRRKQKVHLREYMDGLLSDAKRKNVETIAYLHAQDRKQLQRFIGESNWDYKPLLHELTSQVGQELGEGEQIAVADKFPVYFWMAVKDMPAGSTFNGSFGDEYQFDFMPKERRCIGTPKSSTRPPLSQ